MLLQPFTSLYKYKKSDVAVFLGSGPSILSITEDEWSAINTFDKWTVNNWVYHPFIIPNFYHVEVKSYNFHIMKRRFEEKRKQYKNVKFIFKQAKKIKLRRHVRIATHTVVGNAPHKFDYKVYWRGKSLAKTKKVNAKYKMKKNILTNSYVASITILFELMYKMGYSTICLYGVDLNSSLYFWTGGSAEYGEVHHQSNKEHEGKDPKLPHNTYKIKDFIIDFNNRWMLPLQKQIVVGHTKTALYPGLEHKPILEIAR